MIGTICFLATSTLNWLEHYYGPNPLIDLRDQQPQDFDYAVNEYFNLLSEQNVWLAQMFPFWNKQYLQRAFNACLYQCVQKVPHPLTGRLVMRCFPTFSSFSSWPACVDTEMKWTSTAGTNAAGPLLHTNPAKLFPVAFLAEQVQAHTVCGLLIWANICSPPHTCRVSTELLVEFHSRRIDLYAIPSNTAPSTSLLAWTYFLLSPQPQPISSQAPFPTLPWWWRQASVTSNHSKY